jgi:hypothetical protein
MNRKSTQKRGAGTDGRKLPRVVIAGGSALALGGLGVAIAPVEPAGADHAGVANSGILNTGDWRVCGPGWRPGTLPEIAFNWALAMWDQHADLTVHQDCGNFNVNYAASSYPATWFGETTCPSGVGANRNCALKNVALNTNTLDAAANPTIQWKKTACHEFGHVGGLGHRDLPTPDLTSCMASGAAPPISAAPNAHDNDAIDQTYPR